MLGRLRTLSLDSAALDGFGGADVRPAPSSERPRFRRSLWGDSLCGLRARLRSLLRISRWSPPPRDVPKVYVKFTQHLDRLDIAERSKIEQGMRNPSMRYMVSGSAALPVPTMQSWATAVSV